MSTTQLVSPPQSADADRSQKCYVESDGQLYETFWEGSTCYPDFSRAPLYRVKLSLNQHATWSCSRLLDFGSGAVIRTFDEGPFPIVKIAHPNVEARSQIRHEYNFIKGMADFAGIVRAHPEPLTNEEGIYGFRMEHLHKIEFQDVEARSKEVWEMVKTLHALGYCHGDLSPSNVMRNGAGHLVLIDFSFSGRIGEPVPCYFPSWAHRGGVFDQTTDEDALKILF
jgi:serine/threonine protein kinase